MFPFLAWAALQLQYSPMPCGGLRKHFTKPFSQPDAPDCMNTTCSICVNDSLSVFGIMFEVSSSCYIQTLKKSPERLSQNITNGKVWQASNQRCARAALPQVREGQKGGREGKAGNKRASWLGRLTDGARGRAGVRSANRSRAF